MATDKATSFPASGKIDDYQMVTDRIVASLEAGTVPWRKTWQGYGQARNYLTGHIYQGVNALLANLSPHDLPHFVTLPQANSLGGRIKRNTKGLPIVFWSIAYKDEFGTWYSEEESQGVDGLEKVSFVNHYTIFNIADVQGVDFRPPIVLDTDFCYPTCEQLIDFMPKPPSIIHRGGQPCYIPPRDQVLMPGKDRFESPEAYYATLFHELVHSTGHASRLAREAVIGKVRFGDLEYSQEELVAEIGAAFLCNMAGIDTQEVFENTTSYIQGWSELLKGDKYHIFRAARDARKAVDYIADI